MRGSRFHFNAGVLRSIPLLAAAIAASVFLALTFGDGANSASASTGGSQHSLDCKTINGLVACTLISNTELAPDEGVQFSVTVGGTTQTVTATQENIPVFRASSSCGNSDGVCYRFSFTPDTPEQSGGSVEVSNVQPVGQSATPQSAPVAQQPQAVATRQQDEQPGGEESTEVTADTTATAITATTIGSTPSFPCTDDPDYTCTETAPTGTGIVKIHNDGSTITIDQGNNGVDTSDVSHTYDATKTPTNVAKAKEQSEARADVTDTVTTIPEDQMVVMTAANGYQSSEQQENAFVLEQQLQERGQPYMVCFDPMTYTRSNGQVVTVQPDCVVVTP